MRRIFLLCALACLSAPACAADGNLPDTVLPNGMHVGSWSASKPTAAATIADTPAPAAASAPANAPQPDASAGTAPDHLPDTVLPNGMHVGSWSANTAGAGAPATPPPVNTDGMQGHSMTVTSMQSCYDQLTPAEAAEVKKDYLKPYAECLARIQEKKESKQQLDQGEAQKALTPEGPRNYIRVQAPEKPAPAATPVANTPAKSETKLNP